MDHQSQVRDEKVDWALAWLASTLLSVKEDVDLSALKYDYPPI